MSPETETESHRPVHPRRRMIIMLVVVCVLMGCVIAFNYIKGRLIAKAMASAPVAAATVTTMRVEYERWQPQLSSVASLRAVHGVNVTTEVSGMVESIDFKSGEDVKAGTVLAQLDASADVALLHSLQAQAQLAKTNYDRDQLQFKAKAISKAQLDSDAATLKSKQAQVAQQAALVRKKTLRAPFAGRVGITKVNPGQYLNPGDQLVTLQELDPIYVDFYLPQQQLQEISTGQQVSFATDAIKGKTFDGVITAINPLVATDTRNAMVEAVIKNPDRVLLPGMFGHVTVDVGAQKRYLTLPQTAITFNAYGSTVFVAQSSGKKDGQGNPILVAHQVFVRTGPTRGDQVAVLQGIKPGAIVVTSGGLKLKNGTPLRVNNTILPANNPHPTPQEGES